MSMKYIREHYKVPVKKDGLVFFEGQCGRITSAYGSYLRVLFPGAKHPLAFHPRDLEYEASPNKVSKPGSSPELL